MLLPLALSLSLAIAQAQITDEVIQSSPSPLYDAQIITIGDELAFDLNHGQGLAWLLLPEGDHYRAVPRPPGFLFSTPDGPVVVQAGQSEPALHALWQLGPEGFEVVRELPRERLEQATLHHAGLDARGRVEVVTAFPNGGALLRETDEGWENGTWRGEGLDLNPRGRELQVHVSGDGLEVRIGGTTRWVPLPEATAYEPADCSETPCPVTTYRYELSPRGRYAFGKEGPVVPVVQHRDDTEMLCSLGYLHPCDPIDGRPNTCPKEPPWNCGGEVVTETQLHLVDFSDGRPRLEPLPGYTGELRVFDARAAPEGGVQLLIQTGGPTGPYALHLVHVDDPEPAHPERTIRYPEGLALPMLTPEAVYAQGLMLQTRGPSAGVPGWEDGAMLTGGGSGGGWLIKNLSQWSEPTLRVSVRVDLAEAGLECSMPSMRIGYGAHQVVLQLWAGERSVLIGDDTEKARTVEASGLGDHRWTLALDRIAGELTVLRDEVQMGMFPIEAESGPIPAVVSVGTWSVCAPTGRRAGVRWHSLSVE